MTVARFDDLKARLDEIVSEVSNEDISLDDALALYEEAVNIGLAACESSELDIPEEDSTEPSGDGIADASEGTDAPAEGTDVPAEGASSTAESVEPTVGDADEAPDGADAIADEAAGAKPDEATNND